MRAFLAASLARLKFRLLGRLAHWCGLSCQVTARDEQTDAVLMMAFAVDQGTADGCFEGYTLARLVREAGSASCGDPRETEPDDRPRVH